MKTINIKDVIIGEGIPKIAVSITGTSKKEIIEIAEGIDKRKVDIVEWRADYFKDVFEIEKVLEVLKCLANLLGNMPLIFTFRTKEEGGEKKISMEYYTTLNKAVAGSVCVDIIDIQTFLNKDVVMENISNIRKENVLVIGSNHDFYQTPKKEDMVERLKLSEDLGADIIKLATMPNSVEDVLNLLSVTNDIKEDIKVPLITIAMGKLGVISRICGEAFGSSVTFGGMDKVSAPGQIPVGELFNILNSIHQISDL